MPGLSAAPADPPTLVLASRSPRRAQLLRGAGFEPVQIAPDFRDPADPNRAFDTAPDGPTAALRLAERKAASLPPELIGQFPGAVILTSDTVGIDPAGRLIGTPESRGEARAMLRSLVGHTHTLATGVCLRRPDGTLDAFVDTADVNLGQVDDAVLDDYVASDEWAGKAGGYNLLERLDAGWPLTVEGDPGTVMGLPMARLTPILAELGVARTAPQPARR